MSTMHPTSVELFKDLMDLSNQMQSQFVAENSQMDTLWRTKKSMQPFIQQQAHPNGPDTTTTTPEPSSNPDTNSPP